MNSKYQNKIIEMNNEYLQLLKNPEVQKSIWKNERKPFSYKLKKSIEIISNLGIKTFLDFKNNNCNFEEMKYKADTKKLSDHNAKISVYTCIFGNIDKILEPFFISPNMDYYIITDQKLNQESVWKPININDFNIPDGLSNQMLNRYCKIFPDVFFKDYDYSIYIDGNIYIFGDLYPLVNKMGEHSIGIFSHPKRRDIYTEAAAVIYLNNAKACDVKRQIQAYKKEGFPENWGLYENSLIIRKHNDEICKKLMKLWWQQLNIYTCRDQLSFMYSLWKLNLGNEYVVSLGKDIDLCPEIRRIKHANKK